MAAKTQAAKGGAGKAPALTALVKKEFSRNFLGSHAQHGDETIVVKREGMLDLFRFLKDDPRCRFDMMIDLTAVDYLPRKPRFEVVYHFKSTTLHHRLRVKIPVDEKTCEVDSIEALWVAADWYERECREMYGIEFKGHHNPEFLLLYDGFVGHPLRKDYEKSLMQPLVPMRPVKERHDYGVEFQPVAGTMTEQPVAGTMTEQPVAGTMTEQPVAGTMTEQPVAGTMTEQPAAEAGTEPRPAEGEGS